MIRFKVSILVAMLFVLAACAPSTVSGLKGDPAGVIFFQADEDFQVVFGNILNCIRCRYEAASSGVVIEADLDQGVGQGRISLKETAMLGGDDMLILVEVVKAGAAQTTVNVYYASPELKPDAAKVEIYQLRPAICE